MFRNLIVASALLFASTSAFAACSVDIDGNDAMQFDLKSIEVPKTCTDFTVNLKHSGKLAKNIMGHNWVLTTTADFQGAANDGMAANGVPLVAILTINGVAESEAESEAAAGVP